MEDTSGFIQRINSYPTPVKNLAQQIRSLVHTTAEQMGISKVTECLKWGEPSFQSPKGSTFRMDWKEKTPDKFYLFFNCRSILVETFKTLYGDQLTFEGNRAIVLKLEENPPMEILQHCFSLALRYHLLKNIPLLGA